MLGSRQAESVISKSVQDGSPWPLKTVSVRSLFVSSTWRVVKAS